MYQIASSNYRDLPNHRLKAFSHNAEHHVMPNSNCPQEQTDAHPYNGPLYAVICEFQQIGKILVRQRREDPKSTDIPILEARQREAAEHLWELLKDQLTHVARAQAYRNSMVDSMRPHSHPSYQTQRDVVDALAMIAFGYVLEVVSDKQIDPSKNILGLVAKIAKRKLEREHKIHSRRRRELMPLSDSGNRRLAEEVVDHESDTVYDRILTAMADPKILEEVHAFWKRKLKAVDRRILDYYLAGEKTPTSEQIAKQMGPGWTAEAVRQRFHRNIIIPTQEHLQGEGCAEFANIEAERLDKPTVELLRTPTARQFCEQQLKPKEQEIIRCFIEPEQTPTYQQVAEQMKVGGGARQIRERVKKVVKKVQDYLDKVLQYLTIHGKKGI